MAMGDVGEYGCGGDGRGGDWQAGRTGDSQPAALCLLTLCAGALPPRGASARSGPASWAQQLRSLRRCVAASGGRRRGGCGSAAPRDPLAEDLDRDLASLGSEVGRAVNAALTKASAAAASLGIGGPGSGLASLGIGGPGAGFAAFSFSGALASLGMATEAAPAAAAAGGEPTRGRRGAGADDSQPGQAMRGEQGGGGARSESSSSCGEEDGEE